MKERILSGIVAVALLLVVLFLGQDWMRLLLVQALFCLGYLEYLKLNKVPVDKFKLVLMLVPSMYALASMREDPTRAWAYLWLGWNVGLVVSIFKAMRSKEKDLVLLFRKTIFENFGLLYVWSLLGFLLPLAELREHGPEHLLLLLLIVFGGDTAAYFCGKQWGKTKIAPSISPNKTLFGACSAIGVSCLVVVLWNEAFGFYDWNSAQFLIFFLLAPVLSILAQLGDFLESLFKRSAEIKDSGSFLPGHGGILDRIDGLLFTAPFFYYLLGWLGSL